MPWLPLIADTYLSCEFCGADNSDNYKTYTGNTNISLSFGSGVPIKTLFQCKNCGRQNKKVIDFTIWNEFNPENEKSFKKSDITTESSSGLLSCPICGKMINKSFKICPMCRNMVRCLNCGTIVSGPNTKFCRVCGKSLKMPDSIPTSPAPSFCNNCGARLVPGAKFCVECGEKTQ